MIDRGFRAHGFEPVVSFEADDPAMPGELRRGGLLNTAGLERFVVRLAGDAGWSWTQLVMDAGSEPSGFGFCSFCLRRHQSARSQTRPTIGRS